MRGAQSNRSLKKAEVAQSEKGIGERTRDSLSRMHEGAPFPNNAENPASKEISSRMKKTKKLHFYPQNGLIESRVECDFQHAIIFSISRFWS